MHFIGEESEKLETEYNILINLNINNIQEDNVNKHNMIGEIIYLLKKELLKINFNKSRNLRTIHKIQKTVFTNLT